MTELGLLRLDLDNFINGHEISKSACPEYWSKDDERALQLLYRIRDVLNRFETIKAEPSNCSEIPNNWISCDERLPERTIHMHEYGGNYGVDVSEKVRVMHRHYNYPDMILVSNNTARYTDNGWYWGNDGDDVHRVNVDILEWRKLSEPYQPEREE